MHIAKALYKKKYDDSSLVFVRAYAFEIEAFSYVG